MAWKEGPRGRAGLEEEEEAEQKGQICDLEEEGTSSGDWSREPGPSASDNWL